MSETHQNALTANFSAGREKIAEILSAAFQQEEAAALKERRPFFLAKKRSYCYTALLRPISSTISASGRKARTALSTRLAEAAFSKRKSW